MEDVFLSTLLENGRTLCISPLPAKDYREGGGKGLGGEYGYFIYEVETDRPQSGIEIIGKVSSIEAAIRLYELIGARSISNRPARAAATV
jgi:hypothetical protein